MTTEPFLALQRDLTSLHEETGGALSVAILDLGSTAAVAVDAARPRPMASVAKWVLAHAALLHAARHGQSPFTTIGPQEESLASLAKRAISQHDKAATERLQQYLPAGQERELLAQLEFGELQPEAVHSLHSNRATARALVRLLWYQLKGQPTPIAAEQLMAGMLAQSDRDGIIKGLPADWPTARMTGGTPDFAAEVGVLYLPRGPVVVAALVEQPYEVAAGTLTELGRRIVLHLGAQVFG